MTDTLWIGALTLAVVGYLVFAMLYPERF